MSPAPARRMESGAAAGKLESGGRPGPRAGASRNKSNAAWRSRIDADAPSGTTEEIYRFLPTAVGMRR